MASILILRLEGVLQSWGLRARWDFRDSGIVPSKSGVIGLISCAMGLPRRHEHIRKLDENLSMGVRADRQGVLMQDFHTVTGERGYLFRSDGAKRVGEPTIITPRQYIQDACFTVMLQGDRQLLEECAQALNNPVWQLYLGRKSCPPSRPFIEELTNKYNTLEEALTLYPLCRRHTNAETIYCEIEDKHGSIVRKDAIRVSGSDYAARRIRWVQINCMEGNNVSD